MGKGAGAIDDFIIVLTIEMCLAGEQHFGAVLGAKQTEGFFEQRLRCLVAGGDGRLQSADTICAYAFNQCQQHLQCQALAAHAAVHGDLPDKQGVLARRRTIAGDKADQIAVSRLGGNGGRSSRNLGARTSH
mgnify:CR=1 FL=1